MARTVQASSVERSEAVRSGDLLDDLEPGVPKVVDQLYITRSPLVNTIVREELFVGRDLPPDRSLPWSRRPREQGRQSMSRSSTCCRALRARLQPRGCRAVQSYPSTTYQLGRSFDGWQRRGETHSALVRRAHDRPNGRLDQVADGLSVSFRVLAGLP